MAARAQLSIRRNDQSVAADYLRTGAIPPKWPPYYSAALIAGPSSPSLRATPTRTDTAPLATRPGTGIIIPHKLATLPATDRSALVLWSCQLTRRSSRAFSQSTMSGVSVDLT